MFRIPAAAVLAVTTAVVTTGCVTVVHRPAPESLQPRPALPAPSVEPFGPEVSRPPVRGRPTTPSGAAAQRPAPARPPASGARQVRPQGPEPAATGKKKGKGAGRGVRGEPGASGARRYGPPWQRTKDRRPAAPAPGLCKLAREYGRWQDDDSADTLCRHVYGD
ncbi:hypothetical protein A6A06_37345 [Streptomyces sp. CB02923]|uniref:hypothetical protein n=1 Tax=Streptomyces sp. CB02923 TaxID=1718985 RepID=UPI00094053BF|nr:hypothetical protein [Streptomyces sp. CB02923]OKI06314.1 hypothetical protein A6A06_37345 [Streptomyces sp. CB02923]